MAQAPTAEPERRRKDANGNSRARTRVLETAVRLFYTEGIHPVGVDRIIAEAGVTRSTFYRHFPGKEDLVVAYLDDEDARIRALFAAAAGTDAGPRELLALVIDAIGQDVQRLHTRGCPFINAAAEYPDARSPVRATVTRHREWFRGTLADLVAATGVADPQLVAGQLVLLRDAALVGGYLDGWPRVKAAFVTAARRAAELEPPTARPKQLGRNS
ncbi:TetR/AcrR family transcriptional regulator [Millisia brevis]|uniref:TetR/AcrR family transcriptional regulator n=1 Tax=Millisia brevis TaxID=264148 RepID=UPI00082EFBC8|nr:TetR/AcrR family transcriptional regulator [Millisia brevis]